MIINKKWLFIIIIFIICFFQISFAQTLTVSRDDASKEYLPGDFVHIVVDAPADTAQITAVTPDGSIISLVQERRSTVWRGIWQVPINFRSGKFTAKLTAVDVAGNIFEGQTDSFSIKQLAVISLVSKGTREAAAYFKVVLYLAPDNKEASAYLAEASHNLELMEKAARQRNLTALSVLFVFLIIIFLIVYLFVRLLLGRRPASPIGTALKIMPEIKLTDKEKSATWHKKLNWRTNPFAQDVIKSLFANNSILNADGLKSFLRVKIQSVGGSELLPFTDSAIDEIYALSKGKPKKAIQICDWAISQAIDQNLDKISAELIKGYEKLSLMNILIADDEEIVRTSLEMILRCGGGYQTDFALDGEEALKKIKENTYGAVLLDIEMPKINGYEVLKQARALYPSLPIIFVTGKGQPEKTIESLSNYGLTGYIEKPFTPEKVLDVVASVLKSA
ncbi:response regulator [Candidatus Saganbacteria bacterium]|nr:response regulator [Candidatus Saganbacteria bacterium]